MAEPSELEQMQRLSETFNPDVPGPLVGKKLPMLDLVTEYAQADPAFVLKTQSLAATHSGYRQIKGDGQCGWRGAVFGYFETLLDVADLQLVEQEEVRLQSFADLMRMAGIDYDIIVDMFDYTWELFADLRAALDRGYKDEAVLMKSLNDEIKSDSIVYHFKMMTSAYMQLHPANYEPFLEMPIADYRVSRIDPSNQEIDQIGLQVMTDAVIAPAGIALDVYYLDRSTGHEVTPHEFAPKNVGSPTIRMLYRPGHYDLVYRGTLPVQVYLHHASTVSNDMQVAEPSAFPDEYLAYLLPNGPSPLGSSLSHGATFEGSASSQQQEEQQRQHSFFAVESTGFALPQSYINPLIHPPLVYPPMPPTTTFATSSPTNTSSSNNPPTPGSAPSLLPVQPASPLSSPLSSLSSEPQFDNGPRIRPTKYVMEYQRVGESVPLTSSASGAAASLSTAHFRNQGFQPQQWRAEDDYTR